MLLSPLAAGYVWAGIVDVNGPLNQGLRAVGLGSDRPMLGSVSFALFLVAAVDGWKWSGFFTLIYIAGLTTVPTDLKDAARSDGATGWRVFREVKVPFLAPAFTYNVTVTMIGAMSAFDIVYSMTGGGPGNATRLLNVLTSDQFGAGYFGLSSATSLVVTLLVIVTAGPARRLAAPQGDELGMIGQSRRLDVLRSVVLTLGALALVGVPFWLVWCRRSRRRPMPVFSPSAFRAAGRRSRTTAASSGRAPICAASPTASSSR